MSRQSQAIEKLLRAAQGRISADLADAVRTMLLRPGVATMT